MSLSEKVVDFVVVAAKGVVVEVVVDFAVEAVKVPYLSPYVIRLALYLDQSMFE